MLKIIPVLIIIILIAMFFSFKTNTKPTEVNTINTLKELKLKNVLVDTSEDNKALGFSGQKKLVSDSKGNIYVAYRKKENNFYEVFVAKLKKDGDSYQVVSKKNVSNMKVGTNQRVPSIAIDSKDNLHVVWYGADSKSSDGDREIKYSNSKDGGESWSKAVNISLVDGFSNENLWQEHPDILVGKDDDLFVVWEGKDKNSSVQLIKFSKSRDGSEWTKWKDIKLSPSSQSRPTIIQDKSGLIYVFMYSRGNLENSQIWYSTSADKGGSWSEWKNISNSSQDSRHLSVTQDSQGKLQLVWRELNPSNGKTQIAYSQLNGKDWSKSVVISKSNAFQFFPHIGINQDDTLFIIWIETAQKSETPNEDPLEGITYLVQKKVADSSFSKKMLVSENSFYPNVIPDSKSKSHFILYSTHKNGFPITLGIIDP